LYHQLAAGALAHLFHQLGLELIGIDEDTRAAMATTAASANPSRM
jgi:hypothetical protein